MTSHPLFAALLLLAAQGPQPVEPTAAPAPSRPLDNRIFFSSKSTRVGPGTVNWSDLVLSASAFAEPAAGAFGEATVIEQQARTRLGPDILQAAQELRITSDISAGDILKSGETQSRLLDQELSSWQVVEARYYASKRIEIDGELDLVAWLKPVLNAMALADVPQGKARSNNTGVVIDARGVSLEPAIAPRILAPSGESIFGIEAMNALVARKRAPVVYVTSPADPRCVRRAGAEPLLVRAVSSKDGVDIVLAPDDAIRMKTTLMDPWIAAEGRLAVVVDP